MTQRQRYWTLAAVILGMLPAALDQTVVDTAMPRMIAELGGLTLWSWVIAAYLLASTALVPVVGRLVDLYGRKRFFLAAVGLFVGASALCGTVHSMAGLILWRTLQGLGGGVLFPIGSTLIGDLFPGKERARLQGIYVGVFGLATVIGPQVGGWLVDGWGWRSIFYLNLPLGVLAMVLLALVYRETPVQVRAAVDWAGAVLSTAGVALLLLGLQQGGMVWPWMSWQTLGALTSGVLLVLAFVAVELRVAAPILDLRLFRDRLFAGVCTVALLQGAGLLGAVIFVPWFLQGVRGVSASAAGSLLMPMMLALIVAATGGSVLARRNVAYRNQMAAGMLLVGAAFVLMSRFAVSTGRPYVLLTLVLAGMGAGLIMPLLNIAVQNAYPREQRGTVTAATTFFRSLGSVAGTALFMARFNGAMTGHLRSVLAPSVATLPPALLAQPVQLVQLLLRSDEATALPAASREPVLAAVRELFTASVRSVSVLGVGLCLLGVAAALCLGRASMATAAHADQTERGDWTVT